MSKAQAILRLSNEIRRLTEVIAVILVLLGGDSAYAQAKVVWSSFGSGMSLAIDKNMNYTSVLGESFIGRQSAGDIVLSNGFGSFVLAKGVTSGVSNLSSGIPLKFALSQNFPNPFNPSTKIQYSIEKATMVSLKVYNLLGSEVATLVDAHRDAGVYTVSFPVSGGNNSNLASGVYFYRLVAGSFVSIKKLVLLK